MKNWYVYPMKECSWKNRYSILAGIITCLMVAGIPAAIAADETTPQPAGGTITVFSYPHGAAVYLNGVYRGDTPATLLNVPPGDYFVNVSMAGYNNESFLTTIYPGSTRDFGVNLEKASGAPITPTGDGSIAVDSNPGGAAVTLDGNPVGTTPTGRAALILNAVPAGSHTVTVELAGYPPYTSTVTVIRNQVVQVNADFEQRSPTITGTPIATTDRGEPVPLSPLTAVAAAGLICFAAAFRRS
jgi:hypothetical protein